MAESIRNRDRSLELDRFMGQYAHVSFTPDEQRRAAEFYSIAPITWSLLPHIARLVLTDAFIRE